MPRMPTVTACSTRSPQRGSYPNPLDAHLEETAAPLALRTSPDVRSPMSELFSSSTSSRGKETPIVFKRNPHLLQTKGVAAATTTAEEQQQQQLHATQPAIRTPSDPTDEAVETRTRAADGAGRLPYSVSSSPGPRQSERGGTAAAARTDPDHPINNKGHGNHSNRNPSTGRGTALYRSGRHTKPNPMAVSATADEGEMNGDGSWDGTTTTRIASQERDGPLRSRRTLDQRCRESHRRFLELCGKRQPRRSRRDTQGGPDGEGLRTATTSAESSPSGHLYSSSRDRGVAMNRQDNRNPYSVSFLMATPSPRDSVVTDRHDEPAPRPPAPPSTSSVSSRRSKVSSTATTAGGRPAEGEYPSLCHPSSTNGQSSTGHAANYSTATTTNPPSASPALCAPSAGVDEAGALVYGVGTCGMRDREMLRAMRAAAAAATTASSTSPQEDPSATAQDGAENRKRDGGRRNVFERLRKQRTANAVVVATPYSLPGVASANHTTATGANPQGQRRIHRPGRVRGNAALPAIVTQISTGLSAAGPLPPKASPRAGAAGTVPTATFVVGTEAPPSAPVSLPAVASTAAASPSQAPGRRPSCMVLPSGGTMDVFGYFPTHRVHPEYYHRLIQEQQQQQQQPMGDTFSRSFLGKDGQRRRAGRSPREGLKGIASAEVSLGG